MPSLSGGSLSEFRYSPRTPLFFDSHCHLHICEEAEPVEDVIGRARAAGVSRAITVGTDIDSSVRSVALASTVEGVYAAVGVHPNDTTGWDDSSAASVERLLEEAGVVAVGESGLDFYRTRTPQAAQRAAFLDHIELAKSFNKALIVHTRESVGAALDVLESSGPPARLVFHCWSGNVDELRRALELGSYVSFAGNVSFKSAQNLREAAALVPAPRLLIETDSPYLTPVPWRGTPNEPARVTAVCAAVAEARGESLQETAERTAANARALFGVA